MALPDAEYDAFLASLGRLNIYWASLDRELNFLIAALLDCSEKQAACIATEINDVAPRCRLVQTLSYTLDIPQQWRDTLRDLSSLVSNTLSPRRNRFVHDLWTEAEAVMRRIDRRARVRRPKSFASPDLICDSGEDVARDDVDDLAIKIIMAAMAMATGRFDLQEWRLVGRFPPAPQLSPERVRKIVELNIPPSSGIHP